MKKNSTLENLTLTWIYPGNLADRLDAATWLEVTHELRQIGWNVNLIHASQKANYTLDGVTVTGIEMPDIYFVRQLVYHFRLYQALLDQWQQTDIIFFHQVSAIWLLPLWLLRFFRKKGAPLFVMDTRTVPMSYATLKNRARAYYEILMNRLANVWTDGQTAITQRIADVAKIPPDKLWGVWPSGVNSEQFAPAHVERTWSCTGEPVRLIYIGALLAERHIYELCEAVTIANDNGMEITFTIIGDGEARPALERFAQKTNGCVQLLPSVPHAEIPYVLSQADVGVLPFPDEEMFQVSSPIKLFEYMAAGLPILATCIVCHTDVIGNSKCVVWAEDATTEGLLAALESLWQMRDDLADMGKTAEMHASAWTWHASAIKLDTALRFGLKSKDYLIEESRA